MSSCGEKPEGCDGNCDECTLPHGLEAKDKFAKLMEMMLGKRPEAEFEPLLNLSEEQRLAWDSFEARVKVLEDQKKEWEAKARKLKLEKDLWWANLREVMKPEDADRDTLKCDNGIIFGSVDVPNKE